MGSHGRRTNRGCQPILQADQPALLLRPSRENQRGKKSKHQTRNPIPPRAALHLQEACRTAKYGFLISVPFSARARFSRWERSTAGKGTDSSPWTIRPDDFQQRRT